MPRPLKQGILGASTIILSKDIHKHAFMCGSNFYESDVMFYRGCLLAFGGKEGVLAERNFCLGFTIHG